jgi:hypothetical protein
VITSIVTICQTIIVEIRTIVITVVQPPSGGEGDDTKVKV